MLRILEIMPALPLPLPPQPLCQHGRTRALGWPQPEFVHAGKEVVGTVVVVFRAIEQLIAIVIASGHEGVVHPGRCVVYKGQNRPTPISDHGIAGMREYALQISSQVLHRHVFCEVLGIERPRIDNLTAVGVGDHQRLTLK